MEKTINKYITGQFALNVHNRMDEEEPTGDWHDSIWNNIQELPDPNVEYAGEGYFINTIKFWGNYGIYEGSNAMKEKNIILKEDSVFIANYYRAILDMVYEGLFKYEKIYHLNFITDDHLDNKEQVMEVINRVVLLEKHLNQNQKTELKRWIHNEINSEAIRNEGMKQ
jgi:hypothetical protein